jgi:hypothetical protein
MCSTIPRECIAAEAQPHAAALTPLHHNAYMWGYAVLINFRAAHPNLSKKERNSFLLLDLGVVWGRVSLPRYPSPSI